MLFAGGRPPVSPTADCGHLTACSSAAASLLPRSVCPPHRPPASWSSLSSIPLPSSLLPSNTRTNPSIISINFSPIDLQDTRPRLYYYLPILDSVARILPCAGLTFVQPARRSLAFFLQNVPNRRCLQDSRDPLWISLDSRRSHHLSPGPRQDKKTRSRTGRSRRLHVFAPRVATSFPKSSFRRARSLLRDPRPPAPGVDLDQDPGDLAINQILRRNPSSLRPGHFGHTPPRTDASLIQDGPKED